MQYLYSTIKILLWQMEPGGEKRNGGRIMRKRIALLLAVLLLTGCTMDNKADSPENAASGDMAQLGSEGNYGRTENSWQASHIALENRYDSITVSGDMVYGCRRENGKTVIEYLDRESLAVRQSVPLTDSIFVQNIAADGQGNLYLYGSQDGSDKFWKLNGDGSLQALEDFVLEDTENAGNITPSGILADDQGYIYVWYRMDLPSAEVMEDSEEYEGYGEDVEDVEDIYMFVDRIYIMDSQFNTLFYEQIRDAMGMRLLSFQAGGEEDPLLVVQDGDDIYAQTINVEQRTLGERICRENSAEVDSVASMRDMEHVTAMEGGFLFCQGNTLYQYRYDSREPEKLLNLSDVGIYISDILYLGKNEETVEIIDNHREAQHSEFTRIEQRQSDKTVLTLGVMFLSQELASVITEFNRYSQDLRVQVVDYWENADTYDLGVDRLKLDLVTGRAPDILAVSALDYDLLVDKGVLADLYGFMEEDTELNRDMLIPSVVKAYEMDGHLYGLAPGFQLYTMWGLKTVTCGRAGVTLEELMQILKENGKDINAIYGFTADEPALKTLCTFGMDEFVDWENKSCEFDGAYFKSVLTFVKEYKGTWPQSLEEIREGRLLMTTGIISSVASYQLQKEIYGGELGFIGYPTASGSGTAVGFRGVELGVNARSDKQQEAWQFVKYNLMNGYEGQGLPVLKEEFDRNLERAMEEDYEIDDEVGTSYRMEKGSCYVGSDRIFVYAATKEDVDVVKALVESAQNRYNYHTVLQNIIDEEAESYFAGQKSVDDVAKIIQSKASLYLQE